jgi:pimeloyl-ACP methyl ester carboxylesterase
MSTWIFLRGLTRDSRHWGNFPARFATALADAEVITPDLPGNGLRCHERSPHSVVAMAEQCRAELLAQGLCPPFHLLAMSLGAMVAVAWSVRHPEEILSAVLINTSLRPFSPTRQRLRPASYATLLRHLLGPAGNMAAREADILRLTSRIAAADPARRAELVAAWSDWQRACPVSRRNAARQLWAASRYAAPREAPAASLLVLAGGADQLVDSRCSQRLAQHWHCAYAKHPKAGHDLPLDDPDWVIGQITQWLAER